MEAGEGTISCKIHSINRRRVAVSVRVCLHQQQCLNCTWMCVYVCELCMYVFECVLGCGQLGSTVPGMPRVVSYRYVKVERIENMTVTVRLSGFMKLYKTIFDPLHI